MRFADPPRSSRTDNIVPMINIVFLLLIFFLMTAQIAPPAPFEVTPPNVVDDGEAAEGEFTLYLAADGTLAYRDVTGEAALAALQVAREIFCASGGCTEGQPDPLVLRADGAVDGARVARLMAQLAQAGFPDIHLVTTPR